MNAPQTPRPESPSTRKSRLPRRKVTPNSAPSRPQWRSRVVRRFKSTERRMSENRTPGDSVSIRPYHSVSVPKRLPSSSDSRGEQNTSTPTYTSLADKPLPPRPVAQLSTLQSPSRDSRLLIDASESPLQMSSPSGTRRDWPSLAPVTGSTTNLTQAHLDMPSHCEIFEKGDDSPKSKSPATASSVVAAAAELTRVITGVSGEKSSPAPCRSHSPESCYESANESSGIKGQPRSVHVSRKLSAPQSSPSHAPISRRTGSLREKLSSGSLIPQAAGSTRKFMAYADPAREGAASPATADSRPHSPSPASFSRPRPGSGSRRTPPGSIKGVRTASRLPIPDSKKPTMVDVRPPTRGSQSSTRSAQQPPTFGNRRLDSRTADILDNGIKRRHMQRTRTTEDAEKPALVCAPTDASSVDTPDASAVSVGGESGLWKSEGSEYQAGLKSDEEMTFAPSSSEDESEVTTPMDRPFWFSKRFDHTKLALSNTTWSQSHHDDHNGPTHRPPPPTSPFTGLLPTIPSEPLLPVQQALDDEKITQTLSRLEGRGSPPKHDVDESTLFKMFGHVKKAFDNRETRNSMFRDAAAAEKYLASREGRASSLFHPANMRALSESIPEWARPKQLEQSVLAGLEPAVSKWSDTTPSENDKGNISEDISRTPNLPTSQDVYKESRQPPPPEPKEPARSHESIGYPSRMPATPETLTSFSHQNAGADIADIARRQSSPTLGPKPPQSSVCTTSDGLRAHPVGFARTTQPADARKSSRLPTPSAKNTGEQRGRRSVAPTSTTKRMSEGPKVCGPCCKQDDAIDHTQTPRAQSRSRYVMDKIGGLFHGKREKKSIAVPPIPRINEATTPPNASTTFSAEFEAASLRRAPSRIPPVPKLADPPQLAKGLVSAASKSTFRADDETLVNDTVAAADTTDNYSSIQSLTQRLVNKAQCETSMARKGRILGVARVRFLTCLLPSMHALILHRHSTKL